MDAFIEAMRTLAEEDPQVLHDSPHTRPVGRLDETRAARKPVLVWPE
jgi:glycine dehydrogenase subunit 2